MMMLLLVYKKKHTIVIKALLENASNYISFISTVVLVKCRQLAELYNVLVDFSCFKSNNMFIVNGEYKGEIKNYCKNKGYCSTSYDISVVHE